MEDYCEPPSNSCGLDKDASTRTGSLHRLELKGRSVSFTDVDIKYTITHVSEFSSQEKEQIWYSRQELADIKALLKNSMRNNDSTFCWRGLEGHTVEGYRRKVQNRVETQAAVFLEQANQEGDGFSDPEALADVYFKRSVRSRMQAFLIAIRDEKEANTVYESLKAHDMESTYPNLIVSSMATGSAAA